MGGSTLTCLGRLDQFIIAEFMQVLFHLGDGLRHGPEREVGVDGDCWQLLCLCRSDQHVVALIRKKKQLIIRIILLLYIIHHISVTIYIKLI